MQIFVDFSEKLNFNVKIWQIKVFYSLLGNFDRHDDRKFRYFEKAKEFWKNSLIFGHYFIPLRMLFVKFLWPSQNMWILATSPQRVTTWKELSLFLFEIRVSFLMLWILSQQKNIKLQSNLWHLEYTLSATALRLLLQRTHECSFTQLPLTALFTLNPTKCLWTKRIFRVQEF